MVTIIIDVLIYIILFVGINTVIVCFSYNILKDKYLNNEGIKKLDEFMNVLTNIATSIISFVKRLIKWWKDIDKIEKPVYPVIYGSYADIENIFTEILKDLFESITLDTNSLICNEYYVYYSMKCIGLKKTNMINDIEELIKGRIVSYVRRNNIQLQYIFNDELVCIIYNRELQKLDVYIAHNFECVKNLPSLNKNSENEFINIFEEEWKDGE